MPLATLLDIDADAMPLRDTRWRELRPEERRRHTTPDAADTDVFAATPDRLRARRQPPRLIRRCQHAAQRALLSVDDDVMMRACYA